MEEPQRSVMVAQCEQIKVGWGQMVDRTRENLATGIDPMDLIAAESMFLVGTEGQTIEALSSLLGWVLIHTAQESPRAKGARKAAVPAKRKKVVTSLQDVKDARAANAAAMDRLTRKAGDAGREVAVKVTDVPGSQALSDYADQKLLEDER